MKDTYKEKLSKIIDDLPVNNLIVPGYMDMVGGVKTAKLLLKKLETISQQLKNTITQVHRLKCKMQLLSPEADEILKYLQNMYVVKGKKRVLRLILDWEIPKEIFKTIHECLPDKDQIKKVKLHSYYDDHDAIWSLHIVPEYCYDDYPDESKWLEAGADPSISLSMLRNDLFYDKFWDTKPNDEHTYRISVDFH